MKTLPEQLKELVSLAKDHLTTEYDNKEWLMTAPKTCQFFRDLAASGKRKPSQASNSSMPKKTITSLAKKESIQHLESPENLSSAKAYAGRPSRDLPSRETKQAETPASYQGTQDVERLPQIQLQKKKEIEALDLSPQIALIREVCPQIKLVPEPLKPGKAEKGLVKLITVAAGPADTAFWSKVAAALKDRKVAAEHINFGTLDEFYKSMENIDDTLLLLIPRKHLQDLKGYRKDDSSMKHYFHETLLIPVEDASLYESDIYLKRMLWQTLRSHLNI